MFWRLPCHILEVAYKVSELNGIALFGQEERHRQQQYYLGVTDMQVVNSFKFGVSKDLYTLLFGKTLLKESFKMEIL